MKKFSIIACVIFAFLLAVTPTKNGLAANPKLILEAIKKLAGETKQVPKQADKLPSLKVLPKSLDEGLGLNGPLITRSLAKAYHNNSCPSMSLRVSLPLLNVSISIPNNLNILSGTGPGSQVVGKVDTGGVYNFDLLKTDGCWLQVRWGSSNNSGWVHSKLLKFEFDNHLTKPQKRLTHNLGAAGVYIVFARSTYKISTSTAQGTAVAISPTVLLTNCHVLGTFNAVQIMEEGRTYKAVLIHDDYSKDKCFIRSLELELRPIANVRSFSEIRQGESAYTIGAPLGLNRSIDEGSILDGSQWNGVKWIYASAQVEPGSSGGGLFDTYGNLIGITTLKITSRNGQNYSGSIAAEDFWK